MRKSTRVVSSGEVKSSDSDSKQTIPGPIGHSAEYRRGRRIGGLSFFWNFVSADCPCARTFHSRCPLCRKRESRPTIRIVERNDALNVAGRIENVNLA